MIKTEKILAIAIATLFVAGSAAAGEDTAAEETFLGRFLVAFGLGSVLAQLTNRGTVLDQ